MSVRPLTQALACHAPTVNSKTDIVIMGDTTREHNKKSADTWSETKKAKAIAKVRARALAGSVGPGARARETDSATCWLRTPRSARASAAAMTVLCR